MAARKTNRINSAVREGSRPRRRAVRLPFSLPLAALLAVVAVALGQPAAAQTAGGSSPPEAGAGGGALLLPQAGAPAAEGPEMARLQDALEQMKRHNPVVARVNGHEVRWAEVVASAQDLPPSYRDQVEAVFPALLDRLVDLRLLADAGREKGLLDDPEVRRRLTSYEDRVLSSAVLERHLAEQVTVATLRARYDALVAANRADREIRARHILVASEDAAEAVIEELDAGAVFISLAAERSSGASATRGGDLGYFYPSRMAPAFAEAVLALEPGEYTRKPVETEFGWHVILLVDRRADDIPSFLDMQDRLREEATKEAVDRLIAGLRRQASLEMFPQDTLEEAAPGGSSDKAEGAQ